MSATGWTLSELQAWGARQPHRVQVLATVDSTSAWLKRNPADTPCLVIAHAQTAGYGQRERRWCMRPGLDLTFTLWLPQSGPLAACGMLTPFIAYRLREHLQPFSEMPLLCKWPNDLYGPQGKVSGTLIERWEGGLLVGTGINWVQTADGPAAITSHVAPWDFLIAWLDWGLTQLPGFTPQHWQRVMGNWADVDWFEKGETVVDAEGRRYRYGGIQPDGCLLLWQGRQARRFSSGACSLKKGTQLP